MNIVIGQPCQLCMIIKVIIYTHKQIRYYYPKFVFTNEKQTLDKFYKSYAKNLYLLTLG